MKKYETLYERIKNEIVAGAYRAGDKLPSKRALSEEFRLSLSTVETSLDILRSEGYIDSKERSGCFVCYSKDVIFAPVFPSEPLNISEAHKASVQKSSYACETAPVNKCAESVPAENSPGAYPAFPFYAYARATRVVLSDYGERVLQKSPNGGSDELKTALKNYLLRSRGISVNEKQIVIGAGAEYLYGLLPTLLGRNKIYGIESPSYGQIESVYAAQGVAVRLLPLETDGVSSAALRTTDANVLHVTPYRSFPTLITATARKKEEYLRFAQEKNGYLIEDDYRSEFSPYAIPAKTLFGADKNGRTVYVNTFSKTLSPAVRIGYMLLPEPLIKTYEERLGFYSCPVPVLEQYVLARILNDGIFERHVNKLRRILRSSVL